ncbi:DUF6415 family natural product biosynthesis protein [Streptomyces fenghuangensis]|uniref:DUF6415 family natural product biosynthesis protein n=1 Tax=Streptomyces chitinivorans TaxID=1257027 RepID=A0ABW7HNC6_9ACTN|nr:DUF6415 family natural product biosynthesis protein [Streptomyces chitinivorans]MDH2407341.1 DUF6415 family natural product biosynthesis protein [Streptomyces chitinivorans]
MQSTPDATPPAAPPVAGEPPGRRRPFGQAGPERADPPAPAADADPPEAAVLVDSAAIQHTIGRALAHGSAPLRHGELVELEARLRDHIRLLLPIARARAAVLRPSTTQWLRYRARLDWITNQAGRELDDKPHSARQQVRSLAHDCRWLLRQTPEWNRKATP